MVFKRLGNLLNVPNTALVLGGCMLMLGSIPATHATFTGSAVTNTVEFQAVFTEQAEGLMFEPDAAEETFLLKQDAKTAPEPGTESVPTEGPEGPAEPEGVPEEPLVGPEEPVVSDQL